MILFLIFVAWRVGLFVWSYFISQVTIFTPSFPYSESILAGTGFPRWLWAFANFDGVHYLNISRSGYFAQYTQAFFPLFPLLSSMIGRVTGEDSRLIAGLIISTISFYLAISVFLKLLKIDSINLIQTYQRQKKLTVWFLLIFPTSFYFSAYYTESLFLFLSLLSIYLARTKRWVLCGTIAAFASATRITGIVLLLPLLYEWHLTQQDVPIKRSPRIYLRTLTDTFKSPILYLAPIGLLVYMIFLHFRYNDALYFWHAQSAFGAQRSGDSFIFPLQTIYRYLKILLTINWFSHAFWIATFELVATLFAAFVLCYGHILKIRKSYLWYGWLLLIIPMCTGTLSSMPRYILMIFPIFMVLGSLKNRYLVMLFSIISFSLLLLSSSLFFRGIWIS